MCYCRALLAMSWLCGPYLKCLSCEQLHICLRHEPHLASRPRRPSCTHRPCMLEMVHLSWPAAHEDHFHQVMADQPPDGPIVNTGHMDLCSATLMAVEQHHSLRSMEATSLCARLAAHVLLSWSHWPRPNCVNRILCVNHANCPSRNSVIGHVSRLGHADHSCVYKPYIWCDGPSEAPGRP